MAAIRFFRSRQLPAAHRPNLVTTGLIVRSVPGFALIIAPLLTVTLFTGRDAAITMNSIKIDITQLF